MGAPAARRTVELAPTPVSVSAARRVVRDVLTGCRQEQWRDAAELAVTEVVTNGVLHAHTPLGLDVRCDADALHVEVRDANPAPPTLRAYGEQATTGRGMALVAAVTTAHGVAMLPGGGKAVWFTIGESGPHAGNGTGTGDGHANRTGEPVDERANGRGDQRALDAAGGGRSLRREPGQGPAPGRTVELEGVPPTLWLAVERHHDGLLRELTLYRNGRGLPVDDIVVADRARTAVRTGFERALADARARGRARDPLPPRHPSPLAVVPDTLDFEVVLPGDRPAADVALLQDVLDEGERLAADQELLAFPGLPEVVALRDWVAESLIARLAGGASAPWLGASAQEFAEHVEDRDDRADASLDPVRLAVQPCVAVDSANRIVAVSRPMADLLGWQVDELVGRRVVAIIPPRFREAHVAGFTRHLATGESHVLETALDLPVLRADGTEIVCRLWIHAQGDGAASTRYVAHFTRLEDPPD